MAPNRHANRAEKLHVAPIVLLRGLSETVFKFRLHNWTAWNKWGCPRIRDTILGAPRIRTVPFWGPFFRKLPNTAMKVIAQHGAQRQQDEVQLQTTATITCMYSKIYTAYWFLVRNKGR